MRSADHRSWMYIISNAVALRLLKRLKIDTCESDKRAMSMMIVSTARIVGGGENMTTVSPSLKPLVKFTCVNSFEFELTKTNCSAYFAVRSLIVFWMSSTEG